MATSFPTASSLGILANGTDQTTALNTALSNVNYQGIIFDYSPPAAVTINGTVTATGKVLQFLRGSYLTGTGAISGGYIDADYNTKIWDTTLLLKPQGVTGKYYSLRWSGAKGDSVTDDWAAIQNDINICTYNGITSLYLPAGTYAVSKGLLFRQDMGGQYQGLTPPSISTSHFLLGISLTGDGTAYDGGSGQSAIKCTNANSFAIGLQRVKGFRCSGIAFTGVNTGLANYTAYQVTQDPTSTFLTNGSRDNSLSPHCGANIDPFSSSATGSSDMYPDYTGYYTETSTGGSTDVAFENCTFKYFTVGRAVSINGFSQNGEIISFTRCWADYNKVSLATGQSQARSVICYGDHVWGGTMVIYDARSYGKGTGDPATSIGLNAAGAIRYLCILGNWISNGLFVKDAHIEMLWSLGGNFTGTTNSLTIENSWVNLIGSLAASGITQPFTVYNGGFLKVKNSILWQYGADVRLPLAINCGEATFDNVTFDTLPFNNYGYNSTSFKDCIIGGSVFGDGSFIGWNQAISFSTKQLLFTTGMKGIFASKVPASAIAIIKERRKLVSTYQGALAVNKGDILRDVVGVALSTAVTLSSVSYTTNTAQFTLSPTSVDYKNLLVGDSFLFYTTDEFGNTSILSTFGQVTALSGGTVSLGGICQNLNTSANYQLYIFRNEYLIPILILGDVTSGSNTVSNVVLEAGSPSVPIGVPVYLPHFPLGTTITSYNSTTAQLTLTNAATLTEKNVAIISSNWIGEEIGGLPSLTNGYQTGYKKGDRIFNNRTDLYPNITYWECTKSGITNSTRLPEFLAYDAKESISYNAAAITATTADSGKLVFLNATSNSIAYTIDPVAFKNFTQMLFGIIPGANTITITPSSGTINGAASFSLGSNQCIQVYSDGVNIYIISKS